MPGVMRGWFGIVGMFALPLVAFAETLPTPTVRVVDTGFSKVVLEIDPGPLGAPGGFTVQWLKQTEYQANGQRFYPSANAIQQEAVFTGQPTLNTWGGALQSFVLGPNEKARVEIGDLLDETGVAATWSDELDVNKSWVFGVYLNTAGVYHRSEVAPPAHGATRGEQNCTYTIGYWKNHSAAWPVGGLTLGTRFYTKAQLLQILVAPVSGNGIISLAKQLIASRLNQYNGADEEEIAAGLSYADWLIGGKVVPPVGGAFATPAETSEATQLLDDFNNGIIGPGHCVTTVSPTTWGAVKASYR